MGGGEETIFEIVMACESDLNTGPIALDKSFI